MKYKVIGIACLMHPQADKVFELLVQQLDKCAKLSPGSRIHKASFDTTGYTVTVKNNACGLFG
jgi:hypothetical protein